MLLLNFFWRIHLLCHALNLYYAWAYLTASSPTLSLLLSYPYLGLILAFGSYWVSVYCWLVEASRYYSLHQVMYDCFEIRCQSTFHAAFHPSAGQAATDLCRWRSFTRQESSRIECHRGSEPTKFLAAPRFSFKTLFWVFKIDGWISGDLIDWLWQIFSVGAWLMMNRVIEWWIWSGSSAVVMQALFIFIILNYL